MCKQRVERNKLQPLLIDINLIDTRVEFLGLCNFHFALPLTNRLPQRGQHSAAAAGSFHGQSMLAVCTSAAAATEWGRACSCLRSKTGGISF